MSESYNAIAELLEKTELEDGSRSGKKIHFKVLYDEEQKCFNRPGIGGGAFIGSNHFNDNGQEGLLLLLLSNACTNWEALDAELGMKEGFTRDMHKRATDFCSAL